MPNIKSAKKRVKVIAKKSEINKAVKSSMKTAIKKVEIAVSEGDKDKASLALTNAVKLIDKASKKNVVHKNNASRKKSRLAIQVNRLENSAQ